jgi:alpha-beta hydrolase superfamily lysophospholipase
VIILHRGHEHSGRVGHLVKELQLENRWVFAFDLRGHGKSPGSRGWAPSFDTWVKDLNAFSIFLRTQYNITMDNTVLVANSVGSVMAVQWVHDYSPGIRGMVLAAPAFQIKLYVPLALTFLRFARLFSDQLFVNSYVRSGMLTRDPEQAKSYDNDPLITKRIAVTILVSLFDSVKRLMSDAQTIEVPTLVLSAGSDVVVSSKAQKEFYDKISSTKKQFVDLPGFKHAVFHEKDREQVAAPARKFIEECFEVKKKIFQ